MDLSKQRNLNWSRIKIVHGTKLSKILCIQNMIHLDSVFGCDFLFCLFVWVSLSAVFIAFLGTVSMEQDGEKIVQ